MTRRRRRRNQRFAGSAIVAGLLLTAVHGHTPAPASTASATASATGCGGSNEALANCMAASGYGWTGDQATCLDELWNNESGFNAYAANSTSDARGIPQNINGWSTGYQPGNARQQIAWGLGYIHDRYGTPCAAWAFETSHIPNWY
jgi:hypothetical protein